MTAAINAQPLYMAVILGGLGFLGLWCLVAVALAPIVGRALRDRREWDAQTAADFGEPTRAEVESDWVFGPLVLYGPAATWPTDTPIYEETAAVIARRAALDIDADWRALNGGGSRG